MIMIKKQDSYFLGNLNKHMFKLCTNYMSEQGVRTSFKESILLGLLKKQDLMKPIYLELQVFK